MQRSLITALVIVIGTASCVAAGTYIGAPKQIEAASLVAPSDPGLMQEEEMLLSPSPSTTVVTVYPSSHAAPQPQDKQDADSLSAFSSVLEKAAQAGIGVALVDPHNMDSLYRGGQQAVYSASTIKVAIAATVENSLKQDAAVTITPAQVVGGAGYTGAGTYTVAELEKRMISSSDNTATNALIRAVGGFAPVNDTIHRAGVSHGYSLSNFMMDGRNTSEVSPQASARFLVALWRCAYQPKNSRHVVSPAGARRIIQYMHQQQNRSKLPARVDGIDPSAFANKTGENTGVSHDIAFVTKGKKTYVLTAIYAGGNTAGANYAMQQLGFDVYNLM